MSIDNKVVSSGSLLEDMSPPIMPAREIPDPNDSKPEDWDDRERIEESKKSFDVMIKNENLKGVPLLLLANKQDLPGKF